MKSNNVRPDPIVGVVLRERKKKSYPGCRKLAVLIEKKYSLKISKSTINNILKGKGIKEVKGRKEQVFFYTGGKPVFLGAYLLKAIDEEIGFFNYIADCLKVIYPPKGGLSLKKLILFLCFSFFLKEDEKKAYSTLKASGLKSVPIKAINNFLKRIYICSPKINFANLKGRLEKVFSLGLLFGNGKMLFCDGPFKMLSSYPGAKKGSSTYLCGGEKALERMKKLNTLMIFSASGFNHFSPPVFHLINSIKTGLKRVDFLDGKSKALKSRAFSGFKPSFLMGYYPRSISKSIRFIKKPRFKKVEFAPFGSFYLGVGVSEFTAAGAGKKVKLANILIKRNKYAFPCWGMIADKKPCLEIIKEYFYRWPYLDGMFREDFEAGKKSHSYSAGANKKNKDILPPPLAFNSFLQVRKIMEVLYSILKKRIGCIEKRDMFLKGAASKGKGIITISIKKMPVSLKKRINKVPLYVEGKRLLIC